MSIDRWLDVESVTDTYDGILFRHINKQNWVICRDTGGLRLCHREWSKSEKEKQIPCINACIWNLEKWYSWNYLQDRNRDADIENSYVDMGVGKEKWDELGDWDGHV